MSDILKTLASFSPFSSGKSAPNNTDYTQQRADSLDSFLSGPTKLPPPDPKPAPKQPTLTKAQKEAQDLAQIKAANTNADTLALFNLSQERGNKLTADNQYLKDWNSLTPDAFKQKWGQDVYNQVAATKIGASELNRIEATKRDPVTRATDAAIGLATGAAGMVVDSAALAQRLFPGARLVDNALSQFAGTSISGALAKTSQAIQDYGQSHQSPELNRLRYLDSLRTQLDNQDNKKQAKTDKANGMGDTAVALRTFGRDIVDGAKRYYDNPAVAGDAVASGVGSLLVGGPESKLITKTAGAVDRVIANKIEGRVANAVAQDGLQIARDKAIQSALDKVSFPLAVGAMEGGGAVNQTYNDVINTPFDQLAQQSPDFKKLKDSGASDAQLAEARRKMAYDSSTVAGAIQAPIGAITGKLVEPIEKSPLSRVGHLPADATKEFTEEFLQSGSGQLAQNVGEKTSGANPNVPLTKDVGSQAIQGGLAGAGTAGAVQGPGIAVRTTAKAATLPFKAAVFTAQNRLEGKFNRVKAKIDAESPVSQEKISQGISTATAETPKAVEAVQKMAANQNADPVATNDYVAKIQQNAQTSDAELQAAPPILQHVFGAYAQQTNQKPNRFEVAKIAADVAGNENVSVPDRIASAAFLLNIVDAQDKLFYRELPAFLDNVDHNTQEYQTFKAYAEAFDAIPKEKGVREAMAWAVDKMSMPSTDISKVDLNSQEGQQTVDNAVTVATYNPTGVDPKASEQILQHAANGDSNITPDQARIIRGATALLDAANIYAARMRLIEPGVADSVQNGIDFVSQEIASKGGSKDHQLSLKQHVSGIAQAIKSGDTKLAKERVQHLSNFAQSMKNKAEAISESMRISKDKGTRFGPNVAYQALGPNGKFYEAKIPFKSDRLVQQIHAEATAAITLANNFAKDYQEYGVGIIKAPSPALSGNNENINKNAPAVNSENRGSSTAKPASDPQQAQATTTETKAVDAAKTQPELPLPPSETTRAAKDSAPVGEAGSKATTGTVTETQSAVQKPKTQNEPAAPANGVGVKAVETKATGSTENAKPVSGSKPKIHEVGNQAPSTFSLDAKDLLNAFDTTDANQDPENTVPSQYPDLLKSQGVNWFQKAFRSPRKQISRLAKLARPLQELRGLMSSPQSLVDFMDGKDVNYNVTAEDRRDYHQLITKGGEVLKHMNERLKAKLTAKDKEGKTLLDKLGANEDPILRFRDLLVMNLLDRTENSLRYNPQLIESAVLAGLDWTLNAQERTARLEKEDVAKIMDVSAEEAGKYVDVFNRGLSLSDAKRNLAQHIMKFWNVSQNSKTAQLYTVGIAESAAAEVLYGLQAAGLLELGQVSFPEVSDRSHNRVWFDTRKQAESDLVKSIQGVSELIGDLMLVSPEKGGWSVGEPITEVDNHQLKDPTTPTTSQQKTALANAQKAGHKPNLRMFRFVTAMGKEAFVTIHSRHQFKEGDLIKNHEQLGMNKGHHASVIGKMRTWANSYDNVQKMMAKMEAHLTKARKDPNSRGTLEDMRMYFKYAISSLGRMQMQGLSNVQADKYSREVFLATESKTDLSNENSDNFGRFALAIAQGLDDVKVGKMPRADVIEHVRKEAMTEGGKFRPLVQMLKTWLKDQEKDPNKPIPRDLLNELYKLNIPMHGWHGAMELAHYENLRDAGKDLSKFTTSLYLEADGVTNGPINAMMLMFGGAFSGDMLRLVTKGGVFAGKLGQTLNDYVADKRDLYKEVADKTRDKVNRFNAMLQEYPDVHEQAMAFQRVLSTLNMKDVRIEQDANGNATISYERGLAKNPLTITVYASGRNGIAGNIADAMVNVIYEKMSEQLAGKKGLSKSFQEDLNKLFGAVPQTNEDGQYTLRHFKGNDANFSDPSTFLLTKFQFDNLRRNTRIFLVNQLGSAIDETVMDHVSKTTNMIQQATQIQSVVMRAMFHNAVVKALADRKLNPDKYPDYREGDFLSKSELDAILNQVRPFGPHIQTGTQTYSIAGSERSDILSRFEIDPKTGKEKQIPINYTAPDGRTVKVNMPESFSRSLSGDLRTPAFVHGPALAGVRMVPTMVIGSGDGQMMLNGVAEHPDMAARSGLVFDGFNMPLDKIEQYSEAMNKAVFDTWTNNKAISAMAKSFSDFMALDPITQALAENPENTYLQDTLLELSKAVEGHQLKEPIAMEKIHAFAADLKASLEDAAAIKEAHKQVLKEMPWSIDQMNSGGGPFVNQGSLEFPQGADFNEMARVLNERLSEITGRDLVDGTPDVSQAQTEEPAKEIQAAIEDNSRKDVSGVQEFTDTEFERMLKKFKLAKSPVHKEMVLNAFRAIKGQGYRFVIGDPAQLDAWEQAYNAERFVPGSNDGYGKIDPVSKVVFIRKRGAVKSMETVVHELIHAATIHKVKAFYENPNSLSKEDRDAVHRIEGLMGEWIARDTSNDTGEFLNANHEAASTIEGYLIENGRRTQDPLRKANALNEFMAWTLANQHLAEQAAKEKVRSKIYRIAKDTLAAIKSLIWGGPNKGPRVGDSVLSNLRFNTRVLMATPTPVEAIRQDSNELALYHSPSFGQSQRLIDIRERFNNKIVAFIKDNTERLPTKASRDVRVRKALVDAHGVATGFASSFPDLQTPQAFSTFKSIVAAMMVDTELNPNALTRIEELYAHVIKNLSVEDLQRDPNSQDQNDIQQAQNKLNALNGIDVGMTDEHGRSTLMSSFLALAMVDDSFRNVLANMARPKADKNTDGTLDAVLENLGNDMMERLSSIMAGDSSKNENVNAALDALTESLVQNTGDQRLSFERRAENGIDKIDRIISDNIENLTDKVIDKVRGVNRDPNASKAKKFGAKLALIPAGILNKKTSAQGTRDLISWSNRTDKFQTAREAIIEIVGRTKDNAKVFDMISKVRAEVQQLRQQFREQLPVELASKFSRKLDKAEWSAMFKALAKTDLAALYGQHGLSGTLELLQSPRRISQEVKKLENAIKASNPTRFSRLQAKSEQLAEYMMTGHHGISLLRNAKAIAHLAGEEDLYAENPDQALIDNIDKLVTLYAVQKIDQATREQVISLIGSEQDGMEFVFAFLNGLRNDERDKVLGSTAEMNHYKGYIPSEAAQNASLVIADDSRHTELVLSGYTRLRSYQGSTADRFGIKRSYYFTPNTGRATFNQGVMQTVHQTVAGIDPSTGFTLHEPTGGRITSEKAVARIKRQLKNSATTTENLLPIWDGSGNVVAYERATDPAELSRLDRSTQLADMMGVWQGRQMEESLAQQFNTVLVDNLHDTFKEDRKNGRLNEYVNVAKSKDPVIAEAWRLIPNHTRDYIEETFGPGNFWIRRDLVNDAVGFRQASIIDSFTGQSRWSEQTQEQFKKIAIGLFDRNAYNKLVKNEQRIQNFVTEAKLLIVVKSVIVPAANMTANMVQAVNRGVPIRNVLKGVPAKTTEINYYIKQRHREIGLDVNLRAAKGRNDQVQVRKIQTELKSIQDSYRRLSIWPLIDAGEFSAISDGHITEEDLALSQGRWGEYVEKVADKLPAPVRNAYRYGMVTRDTALFQGLARAVQYGDFIGKAILYDDMIKRQKMSNEDAIAQVNEAFVNYNRLAGRTRNYAESVGLTWFWHFKLRSMKEAAWMIQNKPFRTLLTLGVPGYAGLGKVDSPITDNWLSAFWSGRLNYSIGPWMGLHSFSMNPWINLVR